MRFMRALSLLLLAHVARATILVISTNYTYMDRDASFGPRIAKHGKLGFIAEPPNNPTGCSAVEKPCEDWIALVKRGGCSFITKVRHMQKSGAIAVAVGDPEESIPIAMYAPGDTRDILIPSVFLAQNDYHKIRLAAQEEGTPMLVHMQADGHARWSLTFVVVMVMLLPCSTMVLMYIMWWGRQRQRVEKLAYVVARLDMKTFHGSSHAMEECSICLEEYAEGERIRVLPCGHRFHPTCVDGWLTMRSKFCPICKRDIEQPSSEPTPFTALLR